MCSGDQRAAGGGARSADPRGRGRDAAAQARRGCARAPAAREGALPRAAAARAAAPVARCAPCSAATSTRRWPPRWRGSPSACASRARLRPGDRVALVAPASPFDARRVRRRRRRAARARLRAGVRRHASSRGSGYVAGDAGRCAPRRSRAPGAIRRSRRSIAVRGGYGSVQLLPLLDRGGHARARRRRSSATATSRRSSRG